jgi:hypothetical protein
VLRAPHTLLKRRHRLLFQQVDLPLLEPLSGSRNQRLPVKLLVHAFYGQEREFDQGNMLSVPIIPFTSSSVNVNLISILFSLNFFSSVN